MNFNFDSHGEWDEKTRTTVDSSYDAVYLVCEYELKCPYHGFQTMEVRGDTIGKFAYALIFERNVVGEFDAAVAQRWLDELVRDFSDNCGIHLVVGSKANDWTILRGASDKLSVWACAGAHSTFKFNNERGKYESERGMSYKLEIRRIVCP